MVTIKPKKNPHWWIVQGPIGCPQTMTARHTTLQLYALLWVMSCEPTSKWDNLHAHFRRANKNSIHLKRSRVRVYKALSTVDTSKSGVYVTKADDATKFEKPRYEQAFHSFLVELKDLREPASRVSENNIWAFFRSFNDANKCRLIANHEHFMNFPFILFLLL